MKTELAAIREKFKRAEESNGLLCSLDNTPCLNEIINLEKFLNLIIEKKPEYEIHFKLWSEKLNTLKALTDIETLAVEKSLDSLTYELRQIWLRIAFEYSTVPMKSPLFQETTLMPFSDALQYDYERALASSHLEKTHKDNIGKIDDWAVEVAFFSSGMGAMHATLQALPLVLKKYKIKKVLTDVLAGYFESDWLIYIFKPFDYYKLSYPKEEDIYHRIMNSENTLCILENVIIDYEQTVIDSVRLVDAIIKRNPNDPLILVIDVALISELFNMSDIIQFLPSDRPILLLEVSSGVKLNQQGLEMSNVGYIRVYAPQNNSYFISAKYVKKKLSYVRDLLGNSLTLEQMVILDVPFFSNRDMIQNHVKSVFDNNRRLALSLNAIQNKGIVYKVSHPSLSKLSNVKWAESPFVFLYLNESVDTNDNREFLTGVLVSEIKKRKINLKWGSSFGFRHHRFEILKHYELENPNGKNLYFFRICMGSLSGKSVESIIKLFTEIVKYTSFKDLQDKYADVSALKKGMK